MKLKCASLGREVPFHVRYGVVGEFFFVVVASLASLPVVQGGNDTRNIPFPFSVLFHRLQGVRQCALVVSHLG